MKKEVYINEIAKYGDHMQLKFGNEFSSFTKKITTTNLNDFCDYFKTSRTDKAQAYQLTIMFNHSKSKYMLMAISRDLKESFFIKLLDHTVYFMAADTQLESIDEEFYLEVSKRWREFLATLDKNYKAHLDSLAVLAKVDCAISV